MLHIFQILTYRFLFLLLICFAFSLDAQQYILDHYSQDDGLSFNICNDVIQDKEGFIWVSTEAGLNRFDGIEFKKYYSDPNNTNGPSADIGVELFQDSYGFIWWYTGDATLNKYNPKTQRFEHFTNPIDGDNNPDKNAGYTFAEDKNKNLYMASARGLCKYDRKQNKIKLIEFDDTNGKIPMPIRKIFFTSDDKMVVCAGNGAYEVNPSSKTFVLIEGTYNLNSTLLSVKEDSKGNLWFGSWGMGLIKYDPNSGNTKQYYFTYENSPNEFCIFADIEIQNINGTEVIWGASIGCYLLRFDITKEIFETINLSPYFPEYTENIGVRKLFIDRTNSLWIISEYGLIKIDPLKQLFKTSNISEEKEVFYYTNITSIYQDELDSTGNTIWLAVPSWGLGKYNLSTRHIQWYNNFKTEEHRFLHINSIIRKDNNNLWLATYDGLLLFNDKTNSYKTYKNIPNDSTSVSGDFISDLAIDSKGRLWVATYYNGVNLYNSSCDCFHQIKLDTQQIPNNIKISENINDIDIDKNGNVWLARGFSSNHIAAISMINGISLKEKYFYRHEHAPDFPFVQEVYSIATDSLNQIWIGFDNGLAVFNPNDAKPRYSILGLFNGLPSSRAHSIIATKQNVWVSGNNGLTIVDVNSKKVVRTYNQTDGLLSNRIGTLQIGFNGNIFIGDKTNIQYISSNAVNTNTTPPSVYITDLFVLDKQHLINDTVALFSNRVILKYNQNKIRFEFAALNLTNAQNNTFAFKLEGVDNDWTTTKSNFVNYNNLKSGKYLFRVKAANDNGIWNNEGDSFELIINPPWYNTFWFYSAIGLLIFGLLFLAYKIRINQVLRIERIRNKISRDLHDDVGSTLSSISMLSNLAKNKKNFNSEESTAILTKINTNTQNVMESMSDIIWAVNPKNDALENLLLRMRQFAADILEPKDIDYTFDINAHLLKTKISIQIRRDFFLIYKEAINNIAKHSACTKAKISMGIEKGILYLEISDNGKGFDLTSVSSGNGLKNYHSRAEAINSSITIASSPGNGTTIRLKVPL